MIHGMDFFSDILGMEYETATFIPFGSWTTLCLVEPTKRVVIGDVIWFHEYEFETKVQSS